MWESFNMGTELPTKVMLGQTLVLMQMTFLNNVRKVGRLVLYRTSCYCIDMIRTDQVLDVTFNLAYTLSYVFKMLNFSVVLFCVILRATF
jgi:hypothetical protein